MRVAFIFRSGRDPPLCVLSRCTCCYRPPTHYSCPPASSVGQRPKMECLQPGRKMGQLWRNRPQWEEHGLDTSAVGHGLWGPWLSCHSSVIVVSSTPSDQTLSLNGVLCGWVLGRIIEIKTNLNDSFGTLSLNKCSLWKSCFYTLAEGWVVHWLGTYPWRTEMTRGKPQWLNLLGTVLGPGKVLEGLEMGYEYILGFNPVLLNSGWVSEWLVTLLRHTRGIPEFLGGAWAFVFFRSYTHGLPKWIAIDLTCGLKCEVHILLVTIVRCNRVSFLKILWFCAPVSSLGLAHFSSPWLL